MTPAESAEAVRAHFGDVASDVVLFRGEAGVVVERQAIVEVGMYCRDELGFNFLSDITAVDWLDRNPRFDIVYHLNSLENWVRLRLKVLVNADQSVPTVIPVWGAANWPEREVWDLFGIEFNGHPDLRRIMMPEGWVGHPLRKDYAQTQITLPRPKVDKVEE